MKHINILEDCLIVGGVAISLTMIQTLLGIVILSVQLILIVAKAIVKIRDALKSGNTEEIKQVIDDTQEQIKRLSESEKNDGK